MYVLYPRVSGTRARATRCHSQLLQKWQLGACLPHQRHSAIQSTDWFEAREAEPEGWRTTAYSLLSVKKRSSVPYHAHYCIFSGARDSRTARARLGLHLLSSLWELVSDKRTFVVIFWLPSEPRIGPADTEECDWHSLQPVHHQYMIDSAG